jgi:beta-galactosidase/beta-glucuronidase
LVRTVVVQVGPHRELEAGGVPVNLAALDALVESGYPRPQLVRPAWEDLCGSWDFAFDDANVGLDQGWWRPGAGPFGRTITVPFPPESRASGVNDQGPHSVVWYRRRVELPQLSNGERIILHFGAVDYEASVFVDGKLVGAHQGGHTPFAFDVTPFAGLKEDVVIVVRAQDGSSAVHQPRGKQDWQERPHQIWYERTTGIWQPVWSEVVPREHVIGVELVPDIENALVTGRIDLAGDVWGACLGVQLSLGGICSEGKRAERAMIHH